MRGSVGGHGRDGVRARSSLVGAGLAARTRGARISSSRRAATRPRCDGVSFSVAPGEILGIAGVEGNGQTELIEAIAGLRRVASRDRFCSTAATSPTCRVRARGDAGLSHIPEDRHARGLVLDYSVAENLILGQQHRFTRGGSDTLDRRAHRRERATADRGVRHPAGRSGAAGARALRRQSAEDRRRARDGARLPGAARRAADARRRRRRDRVHSRAAARGARRRARRSCSCRRISPRCSRSPIASR